MDYGNINKFVPLSNITNTRTIDANVDGRILAGGIAGEYGFGPNIYNALNQGNISVVDRKTDDKIRVATGGITGEIRESNIDRALNKDKVYMGYAGNLSKGEIITGGITGIDGDVFSNIRPEENTKTFNHSYWVDGTSPFPPLQKTQPTTSPFNPSNGKLSRNVNIGGKSYGNIVEALNAWISTQQGEYLKWSGKNTPSFEVIFGYSVPEYIKYRNQREGKWLNTSDWAYQWMDKADKLDFKK